jgi:hypothetical protein
MSEDLSVAEPLVEHFLDLYVEKVWAGNADWVQYRKVETEAVTMTLRAAREAARRMGIAIHADAVPVDYAEAPVKPSPGQVVVRIGEGPAPWETA